MSNAVSSFCEQREACCYTGIALYRRIAGNCAQCQASIPGAYIGQFADAVDINEHIRMCEAHIHQGDETLASCQHLSFICMFS